MPTAALPRVTVVIATRDRPAMLREAIDAALTQDYAGEIVVVVVHDQSDPDRTLATDAWNGRGDRRVRVITNRHAAGLAGARNTGIEAADSELVAFCDDDDYWRPTKLRRQVAALQADPGAVLCTTGIEVQFDGESYARQLDVDVVTLEMLLRDRHTELHPSTFVLRRAPYLETVGLVDEDVPGGFGEDYDFLLRSARHHRIRNVPEPLTVVRWGGQSFFFRRWETMAAGLTWLLDRYPEFETSPRGSARIHGQVAFAHAAMGHKRDALTWMGRTMRRSVREPRTVLAAAVATGAVPPGRVMEMLHRHGRGI